MEIYEFGRQLSKTISDPDSWLAVRDIKTQKARLKKIHKTASKLADLLRTDEKSGALDWYSQWPKNLPLPSKVVEEVQQMAEDSGMLETSPQRIMRDFRRGSAREGLLGSKLPELFEHFFRRDATLYPKGDYVRFVAQVFEEAKIGKVNPSTIIRALTDARRGRSGRPRGGRKEFKKIVLRPSMKH
jgi:hypothetical protein